MAVPPRNASCPVCGKEAFIVFDDTPDDDYPSIRYRCLGCFRAWALLQLGGIQWLEGPF